MMEPQTHASTKLTIDLRTYRLTAIQKSAYRLAAEVTVKLGVMVGDTLEVELMFSPTASEQTRAETLRRFYQELLDQELREKVGEETRDLRTLLLAHAFSRTRLLREE